MEEGVHYWMGSYSMLGFDIRVLNAIIAEQRAHREQQQKETV